MATRHSKQVSTRDIHSLTHLLALPRHTLNHPNPDGHSRGPLGTARSGQEQLLLPGRAGLHARAGAALGPFDVARSSERTDGQELRMNGDGTEGGSQGNRADAGAGAERRRAAPSQYQ
jgi:hypothetical protein